MGRILGFIALLCSLTATAKVTITREGNLTQYDVEVDRVVFTNVEIYGRKYQKASLEGVAGYQGIRYIVGKPEIPVVRFFVDGEGDIEVSVNPEWSMLQALPNATLLWKPVIESVAKQPGQKPLVWLDPVAYGADDNEPDPKAAYDVQTVGTIRGVPRKMVTLHPVRYYPGQGLYGITQNFRVRVLRRTEAPQTAAPAAIAFIVGKAWANHPALSQYEDHKRGLGLRVIRILVDGDDAAGVRAKLQALYRDRAYSLQNAIIIGDHADVPGHVSSLLSGATDHYYRAIDTDKYEEDIGTPDIGVGRLSPSTAEELETMIAKLIRYERGTFADSSWLRRYSFLASDDYNFWKIAEGSLDYAIDNYTSKLGLFGDFPSSLFLGGDKLYAITHKATRQNVLQQLQAGRGFINYGGHGGVNDWAAPQFTPDDVKALAHPFATPVVISNACLTGKFVGDSFAETWMRHPRGAVFFWGSMDSSYWDEDDIMQRAMYDIMYRDKRLAFSEITDLSIAEVWRHYGGEGRSRYYYETYNSFGDPSMQFRTGNTGR